MTEFVHLHNHTDYSLLDGAASISKYVAKAQKMGMGALAITDHGNMFGVMDFYDACKKAGIKPIIGCEFYINPEGRTVKDNSSRYYHLILLATSDKGYHNLMELNSIAYTEGFYYKPRIDWETLKEHSEDLICLSACLAGEIPQALLNGNEQAAYEKARWYKELFGDRYYIEIQDHGIAEERIVLPQLAKLAKELDIPLVATNDIHYIDREDANAHDILLCIGTGKKKSDTDRMRFETAEFYMKSAEEMKELFKDYPEAIENSVKLAERCNCEIHFPGAKLPDFQVPEGFTDTAEYLRHLAREGLKKRYPDTYTNEELQKRLEHELDVITRMHFDGYFLIVRDYIWWAKTHGVPVGPGRGSGAGSLVAYCIDITNVDPIRYNLLFERFLNPERVSMPDFDIDFCFEGRQSVIDYVTEHYGTDRVGQIATFGTLKTKAVVKDVARVLDIPFDEANQISKLIPERMPNPQEKVQLGRVLEITPELREVRQRGGVYEELFDVSLRLENLSRHVSTHACGVVIGQKALKNYVPLYRDPKTGGISTQYTMNNLEKCGLVKMDFLGLKTLTLLKNTERLIRKRIKDFDLENIPDGDEATYAMLREGDSNCVFQFESGGMKAYLKQLAPTKFEELDAMTSLYRPGPMDFIPTYISNKHGQTKIVYPDPDLRELLEPTYGVIIYQEQVMKVAQIIAGFSLGEADILRRYMSKKKVKELKEQRVKFIEGAKKLGRTEEHAGEIFDMLEPFALYGFNKSHSICYTVLAYRTAYLKANYPAEFLAANLTNEIGSGTKFSEYLDYTRSKGLKILPPDINNSETFFNVVDGKLVYGLAGIKGVGTATVDGILEERQKNGPYKDFQDFIKRSDPKALNSGVMEGLINSGSFDCFGFNRPTLIANYQNAIKAAKDDRDALSVGQHSLFGDDDPAYNSGVEMDIVPDYQFMEKLELEKNLLGFYLSGHPLDKYKDAWEKCVRLDLSKPERFKEKIKYDVIGMIMAVRTVPTKKGDKMGFINVQDYNGSLDISMFPKQWAMYEAIIKVGALYGFRGSFSEFNNKLSFAADALFADPNLMKPTKPRAVYVQLDRSQCDQLRMVCRQIKKTISGFRGTVPVYLSIFQNVDEDGKPFGKGRNMLVSSDYFTDGSEKVVSELKNCLGVIDTFTE